MSAHYDARLPLTHSHANTHKKQFVFLKNDNTLMTVTKPFLLSIIIIIIIINIIIIII